MGGYLAADGRRTRWHTLYRSGTTHSLTLADLGQIAAAGIRHSYDLRSNTERRVHPSALSGIHDIDYRFIDQDDITGDIERMLKQADAQPEHSITMMMTLYRRIAFDFRDAFRALFIQLERGALPLVFNCSAGKDRTGVAAALILSSLGVSREQVIQDYLLSELCFAQSCEIILKGGLSSLFTGVERDVWEPVMRVDKSYIEAMFEEIRRVNGSVDGYLTNELGISQSARERIALNLLK
jgi:protein-tyrosine phosphatase